MAPYSTRRSTIISLSVQHLKGDVGQEITEGNVQDFQKLAIFADGSDGNIRQLLAVQTQFDESGTMQGGENRQREI